MTKVVAVERTPWDAEWDAFLAATPGGDVVQSAAWGRVKQSGGAEIQRVVVRRDSAIVGGAQIILRRFGPLGAVGYVPYGPVVAAHASADLVASVVDRLVDHVRRQKIWALFVQPPAAGDYVADNAGSCKAP